MIRRTCRHTKPRRLWRGRLAVGGRGMACVLVAGVALAVAHGQGTSGGGSVAGDGGLIALPDFRVIGSTEGQDRWPEEEPNPFPFRRQDLFGPVIEDYEQDQRDARMLGEHLAGMQDFNPGEFASTSGSGTPRGFTAPRLRNGLSQTGFPEVILGGRRDQLSGFLATYSGRTAPGGILDHVSTRPSPKPTHRLTAGATSIGEIRASAERNAPIVPKRLHYRLTGDARLRDGPQDHASQASALGGLSVRYAPDKDTTWLLELEAAAVKAEPAGAIVLERATRTAPRGGPHAPLEDFNTNGPNATASRRSGTVSLLFEQKHDDDLTLRAGAEVWGRRQRELAFITGAYLLDERVFDGVREPQYNARSEGAAGLHVELDGTGEIAGVKHRWVAGVAGAREEGAREQRALPRAARDALPEAVRFLDPEAPDWSITPYSEDVYARVLALRDEGADYLGAFGSERLALADDRVYGTFGVRGDWVGSAIDDRRPGAPVPHAGSGVRRTTYHAGVVWHAWPGRLAAFLNNSTAFRPARRVDTRTGRIIGNESTAGSETGLRYASVDGRTTATATAYRLWNKGITRANPRYNDPVADPEKRQPQYVSSGEEQFTGAELGARQRLPRSFTLSARLAWLEAITTSSPDLPEEVGRQLPRTPELSATATMRYQIEEGPLKGADVGATWAWVGEHVAVYPTSARAFVAYDEHQVVGLSANYGWATGKVRHTISVAVRNALDENLFAAAGQLGATRAIDAGYTVRF